MFSWFEVFKVGLYYGSYLLLPLAWYALYYFIKRQGFWKRFISMFFFLAFMLGIRGRFVEPYALVVHHTKIDAGFDAKVALIADLHLGLFQGSKFANQVVDKINELDVDYVFIAGDFSYWPLRDNIEELFSPLARLQAPAYSVLGNHDVERPGEFIEDILIPVLEGHGVMVLDNDIKLFDDFVLVGLGPHLRDNDNVAILDQFTTEDTVVVLTHNPDTTLKYQNDIADVTLVGHTHGGQVRLPFVYQYMIPTEGNFDRGLTFENNTQLFVTAGLGMTTIPMRLFNPPVIDVLHFD